MLHISCYGEGLIDFTQQGEAFTPHPGGSPYNIAIALGRLGSSVEFCSQLSHDMFGKRLYNYLKSNQVGVQNVVFSDAPTTLAFVSTPDNAEPEYAFYSQGAADVELDDSVSIPATQASIHHFGSIALMQEPCGSYWEKYLSSVNGFVSFDPNIRPSLIAHRETYLQRFYNILSYTDLLRLSIVDLEWLAPELTIQEFIRKILSCGVKIIALTSGGEGAWVYTKDFTFHQVAFDIKVVDTIGAGDSFMAGFLSVIADNDLNDINHNQALLKQALNMGCLTAALNCQEKGANPPYKESIRTLIK
jgi:fructokinase